MASTSHYDKQKADYAVSFIECLKHTKGSFYNKRFKLLDWQERIIRDLFGVIKPNGYRQFNTAYSSWYNRYQDICEDAIREDLTGCRSLLSAGDLFQIDDGWEPKVGDWLETDPQKFPQGLKGMVEEIHASGFQAGL